MKLELQIVVKQYVVLGIKPIISLTVKSSPQTKIRIPQSVGQVFMTMPIYIPYIRTYKVEYKTELYKLTRPSNYRYISETEARHILGSGTYCSVVK